MLGSKLYLVVAPVLILQSVWPVSGYYQREKFREICLADNTNDDAIDLTTIELIERSGYKYREYYVIATDGYVSQLIELINPRATVLKYPPVLLFHGANIDNSVYLMSSSIQHHPEKYPRTSGDGPITSANKSLAFTLANYGWPVWIMGQRGSNHENQAYVRDVAAARNETNFRPNATHYELVTLQPEVYWSYGLDDLIEHEIGPQMDKVIELTGAREISVLSYSLSVPTTMAFYGLNPAYARKTRVYFQMAPAINADHFTEFGKLYFEQICPYLPTRGIGFTPTYTFKPLIGRTVLELSRSKAITYTLIYSLVKTLFGPSQKYFTNLERNVLARVFKDVSFKCVQHYCQNSVSKVFTKFDYGVLNLEKYGTIAPPAYPIGRIEVQNYVVIYGTYDALADPTTVARLIETTETPKPVTLIVGLGYNHPDFVAAVENDKDINLPILAQLERHYNGNRSNN